MRDPHVHDEHVVLPQHRHHFETEEQQREAGSFGMWLFLLTEIMFFGGLFFAYLLYRNWYYAAFAVASNQLSVPVGALNTAILISSGFFMALGVWACGGSQRKKLVWMLVLTTFFGVAFLGVKTDRVPREVREAPHSGRQLQTCEFINPADVWRQGRSRSHRTWRSRRRSSSSSTSR